MTPDTAPRPEQADPPALAAPCQAWCDVVRTQTECVLPLGHSHEHEATVDITVWGDEDVRTLTNFLVWWGNDGHAFVGSDKAVDTGNIT